MSTYIATETFFVDPLITMKTAADDDKDDVNDAADDDDDLGS